MHSPEDSSAPADSRRTFLCRAVGIGGAVVAAAAVLPSLVVFVAPGVDGGAADAASPDAWLDLGAVDRFAIGSPPTRVVLKADRRDAWHARPDAPLGTVYVQRTGPNEFQVLSAICTHLGCLVATVEKGFVCPCHGAVFNADGSLVAGGERPNPAPRALDALAWRIAPTNQHLQVQWQRFELNIPEKRPLGGGEVG
jgi:Rieske Fe-S protein